MSNPSGDRQGRAALYEEKIEAIDPGIFVLETQTSRNDRQSLLRLQRLTRKGNGDYCYLEIGSHLGGSLLPHLADSRCGSAISIDPRPAIQLDERGPMAVYPENSTQRMIDGLRRYLQDAELVKLQTFDADASSVPRTAVARPVHLALIDGEHTNVATVSDFLAIVPFLTDDAIVVFHDSNLIFDAISHIERILNFMRVPFQTMFLPDVVAAIGLRGAASALLSETSEVALPREQFVGSARRRLRASVAMDALVQNDMGFMIPMKLIVRAAVRKYLGI